jgi:hypothetical protein
MYYAGLISPTLPVTNHNIPVTNHKLPHNHSKAIVTHYLADVLSSDLH